MISDFFGHMPLTEDQIEKIYDYLESNGIFVDRSNDEPDRRMLDEVDFYSGFVYSMLDIPVELYTPIFAMARVVGWSAHRMEELVNADKIIRPAYKSVAGRKPYQPMTKRQERE